jgi:RNA polymerase sigma-70 factor (ECF subfamily)
MGNHDTNSRELSLSNQLSTTSTLVGKLQEESPERWQKFVLVYSPLLRFWIRQDRVRQEFIDDILQETLKSVFRGIQHYQWTPGSGTFRGWLRTIVRRRSADHFRSLPKEVSASQSNLERIQVPEPRDPAEVEGEEMAFLELKARALELVRQSTAEKTWQMFWLNVVEEIPSPDIARQFNVTTAAVRMAKARVLNRLRSLMPDI